MKTQKRFTEQIIQNKNIARREKPNLLNLIDLWEKLLQQLT